MGLQYCKFQNKINQYIKLMYKNYEEVDGFNWMDDVAKEFNH